MKKLGVIAVSMFVLCGALFAAEDSTKTKASMRFGFNTYEGDVRLHSLGRGKDSIVFAKVDYSATNSKARPHHIIAEYPINQNAGEYLKSSFLNQLYPCDKVNLYEGEDDKIIKPSAAELCRNNDGFVFLAQDKDTNAWFQFLLPKEELVEAGDPVEDDQLMQQTIRARLVAIADSLIDWRDKDSKKAFQNVKQIINLKKIQEGIDECLGKNGKKDGCVARTRGGDLLDVVNENASGEVSQKY